MNKIYVSNMFSGVKKQLGFSKEVKEEEQKKQDKKKEEAEEEKKEEDGATTSIKNWLHYFLNYISDKRTVVIYLFPFFFYLIHLFILTFALCGCAVCQCTRACEVQVTNFSFARFSLSTMWVPMIKLRFPKLIASTISC